MKEELLFYLLCTTRFSLNRKFKSIEYQQRDPRRLKIDERGLMGAYIWYVTEADEISSFQGL
ncbi:MAG: hypothetical protein KDD40_01890 [Bdellovibrionales bacterium]|nr:hypothetical protein [Bdellovibrionales bacterium]